MNVLILDDERNARETIKAYLSKMLDVDLNIVEASSVEGSIKKMEHFSPDVALLDINLAQGTSFDLLNLLPEDKLTFKVIFISAYDDFAVKAFKYSALDYLLKPINPMEFKAAMEKVMADTSPTLPSQIQHIQGDLRERQTKKMVLKDQESVHLVEIQDIIYCESKSNYTSFLLVDGERITISKTLGDYEDLLVPNQFFRAHRSYLINLNQVKKYDKREGGSIRMKDGTSVPLSRNRKEIFMHLIDSLH